MSETSYGKAPNNLNKKAKTRNRILLKRSLQSTSVAVLPVFTINISLREIRKLIFILFSILTFVYHFI